RRARGARVDAAGPGGGRRETGNAKRVAHGCGAAAPGHGLRTGPDGDRGGAVQRARRDPRRVRLRDGGAGPDRVVGRRNRLASRVRSRYAAVGGSERRGDGLAGENRGRGGGGRGGGGGGGGGWGARGPPRGPG